LLRAATSLRTSEEDVKRWGQTLREIGAAKEPYLDLMVRGSPSMLRSRLLASNGCTKSSTTPQVPGLRPKGLGLEAWACGPRGSDAAEPTAAEPVERRAETKGNVDQQSTRRTQRRIAYGST
jgi:hypothetical protein